MHKAIVCDSHNEHNDLGFDSLNKKKWKKKSHNDDDGVDCGNRSIKIPKSFKAKMEKIVNFPLGFGNKEKIKGWSFWIEAFF